MDPATQADQAQQPTEASMPKKARSLKPILFTFVVIILLAIIGALVAYIVIDQDLLESDSTQNEDVTDSDTDSDTGSDTEVSEALDADEVATEEVKKIVYVKDYNVWVVDENGENKEQITADGDGSTVKYPAIDWKSENVLSYAKCASSCAVYSYDLEFDVETIEYEAIPFTQMISKISWNNAGDSFGVIFQKGDYSWEADVVSLSDTVVIKMWPEPLGRGIGYDDTIDFRWSDDDTKVAVVNTLVGPSVSETLVIADADGTVIAEIEDATWPSFFKSNFVYYKSGNEIKKFNIETGSPTVTHTFSGTENGHNLEVSADGNFISYWFENSTSGKIELLAFDISSVASKVADDFTVAQWLNNNSFIAVRTSSPVMEMGYESLGLSRVEKVDGSFIDLDTGSIYSFEVED